jgi:tetratricopeptide (TPR) repeat protein
MRQPLCFVLMPFGQRPDGTGKTIDFDAVYRELIAPSVEKAGLEPLRAEEEMTGGIIHKPMFERLILCEYAVADLTTANANVFYELGVRHAARPWSTVLLFAEGGRLPFDVAPLRAFPYRLGPDGKPVEVEKTIAGLVRLLAEARRSVTDSPLYQLVDGYPNVQHEKTDVFRDHVKYAAEIKEKLALARKKGPASVQAVEDTLGDIGRTEAGIVIDLFLSYRAVKAWDKMIELAQKMSAPLARTVMVQEQFALALNRAGRGEEAESVLLALIEKRGPSSETYGLLGRVYKDRWERAAAGGEDFLARGLLDKAIAAYIKGFEADWRDAYPGINAVTLMELKTPPDPRRLEVIPVVAYSVERRIASGKPDYWDFASRLELAVLAKDERKAGDALGDALAAVRESWELETTGRNLRLIREAREKRGEIVPWAAAVEEALGEKRKEMETFRC